MLDNIKLITFIHMTKGWNKTQQVVNKLSCSWNKSVLNDTQEEQNDNDLGISAI